jgi:hypothetical protein
VGGERGRGNAGQPPCHPGLAAEGSKAGEGCDNRVLAAALRPPAARGLANQLWPCPGSNERDQAQPIAKQPASQPPGRRAATSRCTPGSQRARAKRDTALREVNVCLEAHKMQGACYQACTENNKTSNQGNCHLKLVAFSFSLRARTVRARNALASVPSPLPGLGQRKKNKLQTAVSLLQADRQSGRQRPSILSARTSSRREQNDFRRLTACFTYTCHYGEKTGRDAFHTLP